LMVRATVVVVVGDVESKPVPLMTSDDAAAATLAAFGATVGGLRTVATCVCTLDTLNDLTTARSWPVVGSAEENVTVSDVEEFTATVLFTAVPFNVRATVVVVAFDVVSKSVPVMTSDVALVEMVSVFSVTSGMAWTLPTTTGEPLLRPNDVTKAVRLPTTGNGRVENETVSDVEEDTVTECAMLEPLSCSETVVVVGVDVASKPVPRMTSNGRSYEMTSAFWTTVGGLRTVATTVGALDKPEEVTTARSSPEFDSGGEVNVMLSDVGEATATEKVLEGMITPSTVRATVVGVGDVDSKPVPEIASDVAADERMAEFAVTLGGWRTVATWTAALDRPKDDTRAVSAPVVGNAELKNAELKNVTVSDVEDETTTVLGTVVPFRLRATVVVVGDDVSKPLPAIVSDVADDERVALFCVTVGGRRTVATATAAPLERPKDVTVAWSWPGKASGGENWTVSAVVDASKTAPVTGLGSPLNTTVLAAGEDESKPVPLERRCRRKEEESFVVVGGVCFVLFESERASDEGKIRDKKVPDEERRRPHTDS